MDTVTVNKFRDNLKTYVDHSVSNHTPIKVTRRVGEDFIVMSADDWEREQETLYILQNKSLMEQIAEAAQTHNKGEGFEAPSEVLDAINRL